MSDPDVEGGARLDDVELQTVEDLRTGQGSNFDVVGGLKMIGDQVLAAGSGADNDEVYNFALVHFVGAGLTVRL